MGKYFRIHRARVNRLFRVEKRRLRSSLERIARTLKAKLLVRFDDKNVA